MKVKELIQHLLKADPNAEVASTSDNYELNHSMIKSSRVSVFKGNIEKRRFMDDFDHEDYQVEIIVRDEKGKQTFVKIS